MSHGRGAKRGFRVIASKVLLWAVVWARAFFRVERIRFGLMVECARITDEGANVDKGSSVFPKRKALRRFVPQKIAGSS